MADRGTEPAETGLAGGEREDSSLTAFLKGFERLPTGAKLKLELPEPPKIQYTDLRTIYPSVIPFQESGDFKRKKKGKKGRPREKDRILTGEEKRKLEKLNVISSRKKKIEELMKGGMSFAKSKKVVLKEK